MVVRSPLVGPLFMVLTCPLASCPETIHYSSQHVWPIPGPPGWPYADHIRPQRAGYWRRSRVPITMDPSAPAMASSFLNGLGVGCGYDLSRHAQGGDPHRLAGPRPALSSIRAAATRRECPAGGP